MKVRLLTLEQKNELIDKICHSGLKFCPVQDDQDRWIISNDEVEQYNGSEFLWVTSLPEIDFVPKKYNTDYDPDIY